MRPIEGYAERIPEQCERIRPVVARRVAHLSGEANAYAATLYAITSTRPDLSPAERAALADTIVGTMAERGLLD